MNNTFSIQRFGLLLKRQWLEFGKIYLISLAVVLGVILTFYGFSLWSVLREETSFNERNLNFRVPLFLIFGFIFVSVIASTYFAHLGQKPKAIIDLMLPASTFEKFVGGVFFTAILSVLSYILLFYLVDLAFVAKIRALYKNDDQSMRYFFEQYNEDVFQPLYLAPVFVTSIFLLGSIYFEKFHYIKTAICVMIFSGIWTAIIAKSAKLLFEGRIQVVNENSRHFFNEKDSAELWMTVLLVVLTLIFWAITYVRLKEKEV
ncbi:hypothetical protein WG904_03965 [Pedobacter sp. Du54]|uniref:hypothetical protein n=1 Tax=Pedobacter anseongensis TaxID=3133439 RepID=UPI00309CE76D